MYELSGRWQIGQLGTRHRAPPAWMTAYRLEQQRPSEAVIRAQMEQAVVEADARRAARPVSAALRGLALLTADPRPITVRQLARALQIPCRGAWKTARQLVQHGHLIEVGRQGRTPVYALARTAA